MSIYGLHKWHPDYMEEHNLTEADILADIYKTKASTAKIWLIAILTFSPIVVLILKYF